MLVLAWSLRGHFPTPEDILVSIHWFFNNKTVLEPMARMQTTTGTTQGFNQSGDPEIRESSKGWRQ